MFRAALNLARPAALIAVAAIATACVGTAGAAQPSATPEPDPDRVVFRVDWDGGFVPPGVMHGRLPVVVVYADGRVVTEGPQIEIWPAPMLPSLQVRTLTPEGLAKLVDLARDTGLLEDAHYDFPGIADAATTVLTIHVDGATYRVSAYALAEGGLDDAAPDMDEATREGRAAVRSFVDALTGLVDADFADEWQPYAAKAIKVIASQVNELPDEAGQPVAWPIGVIDTDGKQVGDGSLGVRCIDVAGENLETLMPYLEDANQLTPFTSGGATFTLIVRPLLPGEAGC